MRMPTIAPRNRVAYRRGVLDPGAATPLGGSDRFVAALEAWVADGAADASVEGRRRERWLRVQADEEATVVGVLVDLAERGDRVSVATRSGRRHRGLVRLVGQDFVVLVTEQRSTVLVRVDAIAQVRTAPGSTPVTGDRALALDVGWSDALRVLAAEREVVLAVASGGEPCTGQLRAVGADVATLRLDGDGARAHLPLAAIDEIVVGDASVSDQLS
jgi:hypothetical protein